MESIYVVLLRMFEFRENGAWKVVLYTVSGFYPQLSDFVTEFVKLGMVDHT